MDDRFYRWSFAHDQQGVDRLDFVAYCGVASRLICHLVPARVVYLTLFAECITSINVSVKDQLTLSVSVAVGSTIVRTSYVCALSNLTHIRSKLRSSSYREFCSFSRGLILIPS